MPDSSNETMIKTVCMLCFQVCGINAYVKDGRLVKVEGMTEHPFSRGVVCQKGYHLPDYVCTPDRLKYPLKRNQKGGLDRVTWDEALDEIAATLQRIKDNYGARAVALSVARRAQKTSRSLLSPRGGAAPLARRVTFRSRLIVSVPASWPGS